MAASETITLVLAIIGSAGTASQIYTTARDRPRLKFDAHTTTSIDKPPAVFLSVMNVGTRPTTVRELGFFAHESPVVIESQDHGTFHAHAELHCVVARAVFLEPGQAQEFDATQPVLSIGTWADEPLRIYARDINGRRIWGGAARVVRHLIGPNLPVDDLPGDLAAMLATPPPEHRLPAQVEPRWKLWTRRELRQPRAWRDPS